MKNTEIKNKFSVIIVNYNGRELLRECLPSILAACDYSALKYEVMIVDNASGDGSENFLKKAYPAVKLISENKNKYWFGINDGIIKAESDYLLLLNNDVKLDRDCISYFLSHFSEEDVFAVVPKELSWDGRTPGIGATDLRFINGMIRHDRLYYPPEKCVTFHANMAMYDKTKLVEAGMFDPLFYPFFYEDIDLSYRAWKMGFKIVYEPNAMIYHKSRHTINKYFSPRSRKIYSYKNSFLFMWKDLTDADLLIRHLFYSFLTFLKHLAAGHTDYIRGFLLAAGSLPALISSRKRAGKKFVLSDRQIFRALKRNG